MVDDCASHASSASLVVDDSWACKAGSTAGEPACGNQDATTPRPGLPTTPSASGTPVSRPPARDDSCMQPSLKRSRSIDLSAACMTAQDDSCNMHDRSSVSAAAPDDRSSASAAAPQEEQWTCEEWGCWLQLQLSYMQDCSCDIITIYKQQLHIYKQIPEPDSVQTAWRNRLLIYSVNPDPFAFIFCRWGARHGSSRGWPLQFGEAPRAWR